MSNAATHLLAADSNLGTTDRYWIEEAPAMVLRQVAEDRRWIDPPLTEKDNGLVTGCLCLILFSPLAACIFIADSGLESKGEEKASRRTLRAAGDSLAHVNPRHHRQKLDVYNEVHKRIRKSNYEEANLPGFDDQLCLHFNRLPARYAIDVNVERAEDVLAHKRLLHLAEDPANRPVFEVRLVQVYPVSTTPSVDSVHSDSSVKEDAQSSSSLFFLDPILTTHFSFWVSLLSISFFSIHPPPTFGSSPHFEAFSIQETEDKDSAVKATSCLRTMHEITFSTVDRPKLLSQLTSLLAELGLNIQEAHAFSTVDGYSLDVFVVDGWAFEETEGLKDALEKEILKSKVPFPACYPHSTATIVMLMNEIIFSFAISIESSLEQYYPIKSSISVMSGLVKEGVFSLPNCVEIPTDGTDVWEIDSRQLKLEDKIASGSYGDLYRGTYYSQEVAIKVLKPERVAGELLREFSQEVFIMRDKAVKKRSSKIQVESSEMVNASVYDLDIINRKIILKKVEKAWDFGKNLGFQIEGDELEVIQEYIRSDDY
ncbi:hypothetical protein F3Y22_tig00110159pilonHSYRG00146 [Hibiscus syriacus]|uniref:Uncharacterized protein n=1 Tax=Hibiscus syriacus TaxID=106335 RepID=A0A6A3BFR0_HIBSY|nr:hypothetical protein F3Y22_tig00110159pilonHSYRG00146 [Hibiscus syriacus]